MGGKQGHSTENGETEERCVQVLKGTFENKEEAFTELRLEIEEAVNFEKQHFDSDDCNDNIMDMLDREYGAVDASIVTEEHSRKN